MSGSTDGPPAVDRQSRTGDVAAFRSAQKKDHAGHVVGADKPPARLLIRQESLLRFLTRERINFHHVLDPLGMYRSLYRPRADRIACNVLVTRFKSHGSRHADERRFAGYIAQAVHRCYEPING